MCHAFLALCFSLRFDQVFSDAMQTFFHSISAHIILSCAIFCSVDLSTLSGQRCILGICLHSLCVSGRFYSLDIVAYDFIDSGSDP